FLLSQALLPRVGEVIEKRAARIRADVDNAAKANEYAQGALQAYERSIANARAQARKTADDARAENATAAADAGSEAEARLGHRPDAAEAKLAAERESGRASARAAASEVARDIVAKLVGAPA